MVAMLWPDSDNWGEGEIDFMEVGELDWGNTVYTNFYPRGNTATATPGKPSGFRSNVRADGTGWHVATAEWAPGSVTYWLDGVKLGTTTSSAVPSTRMHLVIQVETAIGLPVPPASAAGHVQVDWIVQYARS
jgi:beta-glucanase (GH16 family)